ncbi:MAG: DUF4442 domain-containing protein [Flavobacteriales bacterium]|nr:DUF4442 domain-containing protein [Flavobacteriales bacterium]
MKIDLAKSIEAASQSKWALKKLNVALSLGIPFNKPHGIRIFRVEPRAITTRIPYKRSNLNHIKGVHACGLATVAEFCSGLMLLRFLDARKYRLIMQKMELEYHYQAKSDAFARFELTESTVKNDLLIPLELEGKVFHTCEIPVHDKDGNLLCTAHTNWQIKEWSKVRTK